jgi:hypothetical protein
MEGKPWSSLRVDLQVVARLLDTYQGEVFNSFQVDFSTLLGSPWNVFIRTVFTLDWLAHFQSGTLLCLPEELLLAAQADYAYVRRCFSNFIKNCIDQRAVCQGAHMPSCVAGGAAGGRRRGGEEEE